MTECDDLVLFNKYVYVYLVIGLECHAWSVMACNKCREMAYSKCEMTLSVVKWHKLS